MKQIKIFDTTLRDGEQAPKCSMNLDEKIEVALALEKLNVDVMEAGFAVISEGDFNSVKRISDTIKNCSVASLARAVQKDIDAAYNALKGGVDPRIHTFIATSPIHMQYKLKMSEDAVLERIKNMVSYAKKYVSNVEFSAEDATRSDREFLAKVVYTAIKNGATVVNIPDTVGYSTPNEMGDLIQYLMNNVSNIHKADISVHCHNDLGMAVANSLTAVANGATQIECTVNGLGERAGNAALEEIVMAIDTRKNAFDAYSNVNTKQIYRSSKLIYNILGLQSPINKAIVGANAFAHEAGIHQHGVLANKETYEIMTPESIGLPQNRMVFGKHSGKHAIQNRLQELGYELDEKQMETFFEKFKDLADRKKSINDLDLEALVEYKQKEIDLDEFKLVKFTVNSGNYVTSNVVIELSNEKENFVEVAIGEGPIDAAFKAIDKIFNTKKHKLENYAIHSISEGKDALGEVIVRISCDENEYTGRGLSTDIVEASLLAYINGMNKLLRGE